MGAGWAMVKGDPISTATKRATRTRRTSGHSSKPTPKIQSWRSGFTNGKRDKLMEVNMWDQATVAFGGFSKWMRLPGL